MSMSIAELPLPAQLVNRGVTLHDKRARWKVLAGQADGTGLRIALLASFSVYPLEPYLGYALASQGQVPRLFTGPFNQIVQELLGDETQTQRFVPDLSVVWARFEDLWNAALPGDSSAGDAEGLVELADVVMSLAAAGTQRFVFVLPAIPALRPLGLGDAWSPQGVYATAVRVREAIRARLHQCPGVMVLDFEEVVRALGEDTVYDWRLVTLARIPYTETAFDEMAVRLVRVLGLGGADAKPRLIAFEADGVLWDGRLDQVGPAGLNLAVGETGEPHLYFQDFLRALRLAGHRLAVCSRQSAADLEAAFGRPEMRLVRDDLDVFLADQADLTAGLDTLLQHTGVAADRLVFLAGGTITDTEVLRRRLPQARVIALDEEPAKWPLIVERQGWIDAVPNAAVAPRAAQTVPVDAPLTLDDFRARLELQVELMPSAAFCPERLLHLGATVSEFNLTGETFAPPPGSTVAGERTLLGVRVSDRLGDYGIAGAVALIEDAELLTIDAFLLNCRVLGRSVEWIVLERLCDLAREHGQSRIRIHWRVTPRNHIAWEFLARLAPDQCTEGAAALAVILDLEAAVGRARGRGRRASVPCPVVQHEPPANPGLALLRARRQGLPAAHVFRLGIELATTLATPAQALLAVQQERQAIRPELETAYVEPRTLLERQLANIWRRMLGVDRVGAYDNFFHIGGQSILAAQLIFELERAFGVELPVRVFFEHPTVALMAHTIAALQSARDAAQFNADAVSAAQLVAGTQLWQEVELAADIIVTSSLPRGDAARPAAILLTGATGFLGAFLLRELLRDTAAVIYCHCRGADPQEALNRLRGNVENYYSWPQQEATRIIPVCGDLGQPGLGIEPVLWTRLCTEVDLVVHAGAVTNFIDPYSKLKAANVLGTVEILRFCCTSKIKPLHHVSTLYVFATADGEGRARVSEDQEPAHPEDLHVGYRQSKWVAERIVERVRARGLPITVYRLGRLCGCSVSGACHTNDFLWRMIRAGIEAGAVMDSAITMDMSPVDQVAAGLVALVLRGDSAGKTFHIYNPRAPALSTVVEWIRSFGVSLQLMNYGDWRRALMDQARSDPESAAAGLIAFLPQTITTANDGLEFDQSNLQACLDGRDLIPPIGEALFHRYLRYFMDSGFFRIHQPSAESLA
jgi:thioester reductase-like protein/FkbH-like protein